MDGPSVKNTMRDANNNVTYHVMAYRRLSEQEIIQAISFYLADRKRRKKPEKDKIVTILTIIGGSEFG